MIDLLNRLDRVLGVLLKWFCLGCMITLTLVLTGVVLVRFFPVAKLSWSDEVIEWAMAWMVFMGAAALWRQKAHFCVDALACRLEEKFSGSCLTVIIEALAVVFFITLTHYGYMLTINANDRSPILEWPRPLWYSCIPISGLIMALYSIRNLAGTIWGLFTGRKACLPGLERQAGSS